MAFSCRLRGDPICLKVQYHECIILGLEHLNAQVPSNQTIKKPYVQRVTYQERTSHCWQRILCSSDIFRTLLVVCTYNGYNYSLFDSVRCLGICHCILLLKCETVNNLIG